MPDDVSEQSTTLDCLAITGGIAAGKSTCLEILSARGFDACDTDAIVASIYREQQWITRIASILNLESEAEVSSKETLRERLIHAPELFTALETLLHAEIWRRLVDWRRSINPRIGCAVAVPLLFEAGWAHRFKHVLVIHCDESTRRARAFQRPGMTAAWFDALNARQLTDEQRIGAAKACKQAVLIHNPETPRLDSATRSGDSADLSTERTMRRLPSQQNSPANRQVFSTAIEHPRIRQTHLASDGSELGAIANSLGERPGDIELEQALTAFLSDLEALNCKPSAAQDHRDCL